MIVIFPGGPDIERSHLPARDDECATGNLHVKISEMGRQVTARRQHSTHLGQGKIGSMVQGDGDHGIASGQVVLTQPLPRSFQERLPRKRSDSRPPKHGQGRAGQACDQATPVRGSPPRLMEVCGSHAEALNSGCCRLISQHMSSPARPCQLVASSGLQMVRFPPVTHLKRVSGCF